MPYQPKIKNIQTCRKRVTGDRPHIVTPAKLILVEPEQCEPLKLPGNHRYKKLKPILISETEEIEVGDWYLYNKNNDSKQPSWELKKCENINHIEGSGTQYDGNHQIWCRKVLALPEHLSDKQLQSIAVGKLEDRDKVLVKCEDARQETQGQINGYFIHLDQQNHITLFSYVSNKKEAIKDLRDTFREDHDGPLIERGSGDYSNEYVHWLEELLS